MKKTITLFIVFTVALFSLQAQVIQLTVASESFGDYQFGTNQHGPDITLNGTYWDETPYDTLDEPNGNAIPVADRIGYPRHWDYDFIQEFVDSGYHGFTITNGRVISLSSDSSIQLNNYIWGNDNKPYQPLDDTTRYPIYTPTDTTWFLPGRIKCHMTYRADNAYNGSWDSIAIVDVDLSRYAGGLDSVGVHFGYGKRNFGFNKYSGGLNVSVQFDGGTWIDLDTTRLSDTLLDGGVIVYAQLPAYDGAVVKTATEMAVRFAMVPNALNQQIGIDDISIVGWGLPANLPTVSSVTASGPAAISDTTMYTASVTYPEGAFDTTLVWSVIEGTGCAEWDDEFGLIPIGNGTVQVVATANDGGGATDAVEVTITGQTRAVDAITVSATGGAAEVEVGGTLQMIANVQPVCANVKDVTWSVEDEAIATIDANGLLTGVTGDSYVDVTATAIDGSNVEGVIEVYVLPGTGITGFAVSGVKLSPNPVSGVINLDNTAKITSVEVLGISGNVVKKITNNSNNRIAIDAADLNKGVYFMRLQDVDGNLYINKFVKE